MHCSPYYVGVLVIACALFTGCASSTDSYMKAQSATYIPYSSVTKGAVATGQTTEVRVGGSDTKSFGAIPTSFGWLTLRAFRSNGKPDWRGKGDAAVLFLSADVSPLLQDPDLIHTAAERNRLMDLLVMISNRNCTKFLGRLHASNANVRAGKGIFQTVFSSATAGTVPFFTPVATGLAVTNVLGGSVTSQYENVYLQGKQTDAIEAAILASRSTVLAKMLGRRDEDIKKYTVYQMLDDLAEYDAAASLRVAARAVQKTQEKEADVQQGKVDKAKEKAAGKGGGTGTEGGGSDSPKTDTTTSPAGSPANSPTPTPTP